MAKDSCYEENDSHQNNFDKKNDSDLLFDNLVWLTTREAACFLRKSPNAVRILVHRGFLSAKKFRRRLYFKRDELCSLIETAAFKEDL